MLPCSLTSYLEYMQTNLWVFYFVNHTNHIIIITEQIGLPSAFLFSYHLTTHLRTKCTNSNYKGCEHRGVWYSKSCLPPSVHQLCRQLLLFMEEIICNQVWQLLIYLTKISSESCTNFGPKQQQQVTLKIIQCSWSLGQCAAKQNFKLHLF